MARGKKLILALILMVGVSMPVIGCAPAIAPLCTPDPPAVLCTYP